MNQSRPSIKPYHRTYDSQSVPYKKRGRILCADDTTSEEIGCGDDDRRVRSRSDVANNEQSNKTEISQIEKNSSNSANDEVTHGASMSPVAIRLSEGKLPLAISASEEDPVRMVTEDGGNENASNSARDDVHNVVSSMVMGGYDLVKRALESDGYGSGRINDAGNALETSKGTNLVDDAVSTKVVEGGPDWDTMVVEGEPDWDATAPYLIDYGSGVINNNTGGVVDDVVSTMVVDGVCDLEENAINEGERELEPSKGKEPIVYEWTGNTHASDYMCISDDVNETTGVGGWLDREEDYTTGFKCRGMNVIPMIHERHSLSKRPFDYTRPIDATGVPASSNSQEPLAEGGMHKFGLRLFGFDI